MQASPTELIAPRRRTHAVRVAGVAVGGGAPVVVQSMTNTDTADIDATVAQVAAIGAFDGIDELEANKRVYAENRDLLLEALPKAGLGRILPADGAFYLYADVSEFTANSVAFTKEMLHDLGIAATPGVDFDAERGSRYVRFCYAGTTADMAEAARRLRGWERLRRVG